MCSEIIFLTTGIDEGCMEKAEAPAPTRRAAIRDQMPSHHKQRLLVFTCTCGDYVSDKPYNCRVRTLSVLFKITILSTGSEDILHQIVVPMFIN